jgi:hypothetical protein
MPDVPYKVVAFRAQRIRAKNQGGDHRYEGGHLLTFETDRGRQFQFMLTLGQMDEVTDMVVSEVLGY